MQINKISVIGLGKLGLPLALTYASRGVRVIGYDCNIDLINKLVKGKYAVEEPQINTFLTKYTHNITYTNSAEKIIKESNITFIVVPTPSNSNGSFSSLFIEQAIKACAPHIKTKKVKHTLIITSTISPGTTETLLKPLLERLTGKQVGEEVGLCYSPELIALGSVVHNLTHPDFLFIGENDKQTGKVVESIRKQICQNKPSVRHTNWVNAELIKLSLNSYITTKISFANMIARIAEKTPGADSTIILDAIGQDSRIGKKYLNGGLGFGGPCFPRDNRSLYSTMRAIGLDIQLPLQIDELNRKQTSMLYSIVEHYYKKGDSVGLLGLSYKPNTNVIEESQALELLNILMKKRIAMNIYDPQVSPDIFRKMKGVYFEENEDRCITNSRIILLMTQWSQFDGINWSKYKDKIIIDCWRQIDLTKYYKIPNKIIQLGSYIPLT